ncbi:nuclear transport factor 2 family protein [Muricauda sp. CAU 1633]|uniref:nuclear transport factor 2 family protein n=1 Tax=Allomuricauda sp. CAU 1633 TaxID=2816036 RepID=UPI001A8F363D|nr:nuclear transport factor 2 family protein [Muricauda sp. CAU 1633]MBO0321543.1 nuclear transport factor 2 family protein [Muricauda sp. CAU 1633]
MDKKVIIARAYFEAFHNGNLDKVFTYLARDCAFRYGKQELGLAREEFLSNKEMISKLKFETHGYYLSNETNNVLIDFSFTTQDSIVTRAVDIIEFNSGGKISKITVIPNG